MRLLVCGSRDWTNGQLIYDKIAQYDDGKLVIIEGCAKGADRIAHDYPGVQHMHFPADWTLGRAAGPLRNRNKQMLDEGYPLVVLAFSTKHAPYTTGTANMISQARNRGIPYAVYVAESDRERDSRRSSPMDTRTYPEGFYGYRTRR